MSWPHERLIPALRRLAGKELSEADQANQLLDRRVNEWLGNNRARRYLLTWRELRLIRRQTPYLTWGPNKSHKETLVAQSRRWLHRRAGVASFMVLLLIGSVTWWHSPWGQIWLVERDIESLIGRIGDGELTQVAITLEIAGNYEQARQAAEAIGDASTKPRPWVRWPRRR